MTVTRAERILAVGMISIAALSFAVDGDAPSALVVIVMGGMLARLDGWVRSGR